MPTPYTHPTDIPPLLLGYLAGMVIHESIVAVREGRMDDAIDGYVVADAIYTYLPAMPGVPTIAVETVRLAGYLFGEENFPPPQPWSPSPDIITKILTLANHL